VQPSDDLALERIINKPARGIGAKTIEKLHTIAKENQISMYSALEKAIDEGALSGKSRDNISNLIQNFNLWRQNSQALTPDEIADQVMEDSGYLEMLKNEKTPESEGRIENLKELVNVMSDHESYPTLEEFLEHVSLVMDNDSSIDRNKVTLMTLHSAKGLEFEAVFLPGWEEGLFPHQRSLEGETTNSLEEERRLAYVAITRAKRILYITVALNRRIYGQWQSNVPSRFINEIPPQNIEICNYSATFGSATFGGSNYQQKSYDKTKYYNKNLNKNIIQDSDRFSYEPVDDGYAYSYRSAPKKGNSKFPAGARVFHSSFGYGKVIAAEGNSIEVFFDKYGRKKILQDYLIKA
jgi:DNA helicase-2/ATP-dependent DNA helicase PcrA